MVEPIDDFPDHELDMINQLTRIIYKSISKDAQSLCFSSQPSQCSTKTFLVRDLSQPQMPQKLEIAAQSFTLNLSHGNNGTTTRAIKYGKVVDSVIGMALDEVIVVTFRVSYPIDTGWRIPQAHNRAFARYHFGCVTWRHKSRQTR